MPNINPSAESGPIRYWHVMSALQRAYGTFTSRVLVDIAGDRHRKTIEHYLAYLLEERVIEVCSQRAGNAPSRGYRIVNMGDAPPLRRQPGLAGRQQALWQAMRSLPAFGSAELAITASTEALVIARETASGYIMDLMRAGYVIEVGEPRRGNRTLCYRLLPAHNTGPRAPVVMRSQGGCFDLNLMKAVNVTASQMRRAS